MNVQKGRNILEISFKRTHDISHGSIIYKNNLKIDYEAHLFKSLIINLTIETSAGNRRTGLVPANGFLRPLAASHLPHLKYIDIGIIISTMN